MVKADARIMDPDDVQVSVTITATAKEWRLFAEQLDSLGNTWPGWQFASVVSRAGNLAYQSLVGTRSFES